MEIKLNEEQVAQINAILNSFPISQLNQVQSIIKIFQDAQAPGDESETLQLNPEDVNTED